MRLCACRIGQHSCRWTHYFSQWLHGFSGTIAIIFDVTGTATLVNHGLSMGGSKSHTFAVMLANLPFSLWLLVNTTTAQYCYCASQLLCVNWVQSTVLSSPAGSQTATMWFWEAQRSLWSGKPGDHCSECRLQNPSPAVVFSVLSRQCTAFPPGNTEKKGSCYHCPLPRAPCSSHSRSCSKLHVCQNSTGFDLFFSSCAEVSLHPLC